MDTAKLIPVSSKDRYGKESMPSGTAQFVSPETLQIMVETSPGNHKGFAVSRDQPQVLRSEAVPNAALFVLPDDEVAVIMFLEAAGVTIILD